MVDVKSTLEEIKHEFGGVPRFWETLSRAPTILESYWNGFKGVASSGVLEKKTKLLIIYECILADGCIRCKEEFRRVLADFGIEQDILGKLDGEIKHANLSDETKDILLFAYYASDNPRRIDEQSLIEFKMLLGKNKILETIACIGISRSVLDLAHCVGLHAFDVGSNGETESNGACSSCATALVATKLIQMQFKRWF